MSLVPTRTRSKRKLSSTGRESNDLQLDIYPTVGDKVDESSLFLFGSSLSHSESSITRNEHKSQTS